MDFLQYIPHTVDVLVAEADNHAHDKTCTVLNTGSTLLNTLWQ